MDEKLLEKVSGGSRWTDWEKENLPPGFYIELAPNKFDGEYFSWETAYEVARRQYRMKDAEKHIFRVYVTSSFERHWEYVNFMG